MAETKSTQSGSGSGPARAGSLKNRDQNRQSNHVSVDYTIAVPASASVDLHSISGSIKVSGVHGSLRSETISLTLAPALFVSMVVLVVLGPGRLSVDAAVLARRARLATPD